MASERTVRFRLLLLALATSAALSASGGWTQEPPRLLIAFSSFRDRPLHPRVYFYEHDGTGAGKPSGEMAAADLRVDTHPSLAQGGRLCATAVELENNPSDIRIWDVAEKKDVPPPAGLNTEAVEIAPGLSADGRFLAFSALRRTGGPDGWNLLLYDLVEKKPVDLPLNRDDDERSPSLSGDGRLLAFVTNAADGAGLSDIRVYDRQEQRLVSTPGLCSRNTELDPSLSADGRWLAFVSERPDGAGSRDVYLYDLQRKSLVPLPGVNAAGPEQTPRLTADGRFLAFVAERASGAGERDIYLYDRVSGRLVATPGLNTNAEDFDPSVTYR